MRNGTRAQAVSLLIGLALGLLGADVARAASLELPVPKVTIYPGDVIGNDLLVDRAFWAHTVTRSAIYNAREPLVGKVARRTLLAGQPIPVNAIREPYAVTQGKPTVVVFEAGGLTITGQAVALQSGAIGDTVSLRNTDSGAVIQGTVGTDGTVRLGSP